jgi:hypothetical protein
MSTTLEHTTVEHPTTEQAPPPPDHWKRRAGVLGLVLALGTIIVIGLIQQGPADVPQETFSPETHRDWTPPRTDPDNDVFSPEAHRIPSGTATGSPEATVGSDTTSPTNQQLGVEAPRGNPDTQQAVIDAMIADGFYGLSPASAQAADTSGGHHGLYAADELATMRLVREGQLPKELLETEPITKRLVNEGRIPAATVR